ncbi:MAG: SMP-30/gluconolactonase/LRE family protein [Flammeovirgaceae bacterium]
MKLLLKSQTDIRNFLKISGLCLVMVSCQKKETTTTVSVGIESIRPEFKNVIDEQISVSVLATGYSWSEGPLWLEAEKKLIFSDVPANTVYQWTEEQGASVYLSPSGYTGEPSAKREGSNGLALDDEGNLLLCQHGDRRVAMMNSSTTEPAPNFSTIVDNFEGKRFNSPNDLAFCNTEIFFTDPAYGLPKQMDDPAKELPFQGVFRVTANGEVKLVIDSLTRPNGIGFSPDHRKMYGANSDPDKARWYEYTVNDSLQIVSVKVLYDATAVAKTEKGLPDGLKVDGEGNIFATGPGGIWIFDGGGNLLGKIKLQEASSNCALTSDGKTLFVTNDMNILRIQLRK